MLLSALLVPAALARAQVAVFPLPFSSYSMPDTQITFRDIAPGRIGVVDIVGSSTGAHSGRLIPASDRRGASFIPDTPFAPGEVVTVTSHLDLAGTIGGTYSFRIASTATRCGSAPLPLVLPRPNGLQHFRSRPDLDPPALTVTEDRAPPAAGDIFVAPQNGPDHNGPMILDSRGRLIWFRPYAVPTFVTDFRVQSLSGRPVLTWWQGDTAGGEGVILDQNYRQVGTVRAGNGLQMDLHEFRLTPDGHALIIANELLRLPGFAKPVVDSVIQEIDPWTGLVLFEWDALDHIPLSDSDFVAQPGQKVIDPFHTNSVMLDRDGNLIVSMRDTSAIYKIDHITGRIIWTLGGKASSFTMGASTSTWGQHDAILQPDGTLTVFDNGAGPPKVHPYSRGLRESLNGRSMTATMISQYNHSPAISANFEGSVQMLADGEVFLGWGQQPYFSEYDAAGRQDFDAHFNLPTTTYRAYRFPWNGRPLTRPALVLEPDRSGGASLYASWNGATGVAAWRVLAGRSPGALVAGKTFATHGFETRIALRRAAAYYAVQALAASGRVLTASRPVALEGTG